MKIYIKYFRKHVNTVHNFKLNPVCKGRESPTQLKLGVYLDLISQQSTAAPPRA